MSRLTGVSSAWTALIDGMVQCVRCGCRTVITAIHVAIEESSLVLGRGAIAIYKCAECWKQGIFSPMLRALKSTPTVNG